MDSEYASLHKLFRTWNGTSNFYVQFGVFDAKFYIERLYETIELDLRIDGENIVNAP